MVRFIRCLLNIGFCLDTYEQTSFELGMLIDTTELYSLIPLKVIGVREIENLCNHLVVQWHKVAKSSTMAQNVQR